MPGYRRILWNNVWLLISIALFEIAAIGVTIQLFLNGSISAGVIVLMQIYVFTAIYSVDGVGAVRITVGACLCRR